MSPIEFRTLPSIGWRPSKILEFRGANELRGARDWKKTALYDACKRIKVGLRKSCQNVSGIVNRRQP